MSGFTSGFSVLSQLVCLSVLVPVLHCLDHCSFVIFSEVWEIYTSCLVFFPQNCFGNSGSFMVPYKFLDCLFCFLVYIGIYMLSWNIYEYKNNKCCRSSQINLSAYPKVVKI